MQTFSLNQTLFLENQTFRRRYPAVTSMEAAEIDRVYVDVGQELNGLVEYLQSLYAQAHPEIDEAAKKSLQLSDLDVNVAGEEAFLSWRFFPARLGRMSSRWVGEGLCFHNEAEVLSAQLQALRARKPDKQHFRIAFINGLGRNLGDCTMGVAALRHVQQCLARYLPSFSCDMLLGLGGNAAQADIVGDEKAVERVLTQAPTLGEFAQYDGYFDFSNFLHMPLYDTMPTVDWYMWWCGLDPKVIAPEQKRNRGRIRWDAWNAVRGLLQCRQGTKIFFNPKASVPLRTMPAAVACEFALRLLELAPDWMLVIDQPMDVTHPRLIDLSGQVGSPEMFKALCGQVDGVVSVNSFASHVVDMCSTPAVHLCVAIPASHYPYYPFSAAINPAGYELLPAFRKAKVLPDEWEQISEVYLRAWQSIEPAQVLALLREKMALRQAAGHEPQGLTIDSQIKSSTCLDTAAETPRLLRQKLALEHSIASTRLADLSQTILKAGSVCVLACAPEPALPLALARRVAPHGELIVLEPRPLLARTLESSFLTAGVWNARVHPTLAVAGPSQAQISVLDPWSESISSEWGNTQQQLFVPNRSLDAMALPECHCLMIQSPTPYVAMVAGALETLKRCRPYVLISPISRAEAGAVCQVARDAGYVFWGEPIAAQGGEGLMLVFGVPKEISAQFIGFVKIEEA